MSGIYNRKGFWWRHFIPMAGVVLMLFIPGIRRIFSESGLRWAYMLALSFGLSFCLTPIFRNISWKLKILDLPCERKNHFTATPLMGGAAVYLAFLISVTVNGIFSAELISILIGATLLFIIGIIDDIKDVKASIKLILQVICTILVISGGVSLNVFPEKMGSIGVLLNVSLTMLWVVGITNAMNFFDGMDGMASGLGVIISFFLGIVAIQGNQHFIGWVVVAMMGACLGFIPYNLLKNERATIFLGDSGSTVIGFILACVAVYGDWAEGRPIVALVSPLLIFWVLIFDMIHITLDRIVTGKVLNLKQWIVYVGKDHLHHRLAFALGSQRRAVFFIYLMSIHLGISAVILKNITAIDALLVLLQGSITVIMVTVLERKGRTVVKEK